MLERPVRHLPGEPPFRDVVMTLRRCGKRADTYLASPLLNSFTMWRHRSQQLAKLSGMARVIALFTMAALHFVAASTILDALQAVNGGGTRAKAVRELHDGP